MQYWLYAPGASCGLPVLGENPNGIEGWDERDLALVNGPITAVRVWTIDCVPPIEGYAGEPQVIEA